MQLYMNNHTTVEDWLSATTKVQRQKAFMKMQLDKLPQSCTVEDWLSATTTEVQLQKAFIQM